MNMLPDDLLVLILLLVDPIHIINLLLTSKKLFQIITNPLFRENYKEKWDCELLGFFLHDRRHLWRYSRRRELPAPPPRKVQLLPTSQFGRFMNKKLMPSEVGFFISSTNNGLILSGMHPEKYHVFNPLTRKSHQFRGPANYYRRAATAFMSDEERISLNFKVIHAKAGYYYIGKSLSIQTYSSSTRTWEQTELECSVKFYVLEDTVATVARAGAVYFPASTLVENKFERCLATYNNNNNDLRVTLVKEPSSFYDHTGDDGWKLTRERHAYTCYSESPEGFIRCAACTVSAINIWVLDHHNGVEPYVASPLTISVGDEDDGVWSMTDPDYVIPNVDADADGGWSLEYKIDLSSVWLYNQVKLGWKCKKQVHFVGFVPGRWDSVYVRFKRHIFVYHRESGELKKLHHCPNKLPKSERLDYLEFYPLTMTQLGAWPW